MDACPHCDSRTLPHPPAACIAELEARCEVLSEGYGAAENKIAALEERVLELEMWRDRHLDIPH